MDDGGGCGGGGGGESKGTHSVVSAAASVPAAVVTNNEPSAITAAITASRRRHHQRTRSNTITKTGWEHVRRSLNKESYGGTLPKHSRISICRALVMFFTGRFYTFHHHKVLEAGDTQSEDAAGGGKELRERLIAENTNLGVVAALIMSIFIGQVLTLPDQYALFGVDAAKPLLTATPGGTFYVSREPEDVEWGGGGGGSLSFGCCGGFARLGASIRTVEAPHL